MQKDRKRKIEGQMRLEERRDGFKCAHCKGWVPLSETMGTKHRNQCPNCLWSQHLDLEKPGDRKSSCGAGMKPIGLTFKQEGEDKYGRLKQGELMIVHECANPNCGKISINRIAADDSSAAILEVFGSSQTLVPGLKEELLKNANIRLLTEEDEREIHTQLFGKQD